MKTTRFFTVLIMLLIFLSAPLFAFTQVRVIDNAGLLNSAELAGLEQLAADIAETYNFDLVIVTETDIGAARPVDYADDYFDYKGYGLGEDRDGCLFLVVMNSRDFYFSTSGRGIKILNSTAFDKLESDVVSNLSNGDYAAAFRTFIGNWEEFLILDAKGRSYNFLHKWNLAFVVGAWVIAFLIGFFIVKSWKSQMNTALPKREADTYIIPGSLAFTQKQDRFLYSTVTKKARPKTSSSGGGGSHRSSSGRSHGGGGGKF